MDHHNLSGASQVSSWTTEQLQWTAALTTTRDSDKNQSENMDPGVSPVLNIPLLSPAQDNMDALSANCEIYVGATEKEN